MNKTIEVFRAGTQTSSSGSKKTWTKADLDKMVSQYNDGDHEAPLVVGHPKTDDPAFGWVKSLKRKGNVLFAELDSVIEEFQDAFNRGLYKKRSISLYPDLTLKHVGFLGAMPPAVKGLADFKFNEEKEETLNFETNEEGKTEEFADFATSWGFRDVGRVFRGFREYLIGKGESEEAEKIVPNYLVKQLEDFKESDSEKPSINSNFNEAKSPNGETKMTELEKALKENEDLKILNQDFSEKNEALELETSEAKKRAEKAEGDLSQFQEKNEKEEIASFCESLVQSGRLAAADKSLTQTSLLSLKGSEDKFEFGEGENKKELSAFEAMKEKLSNVKPSVDFKEHAKDGEEKNIEGLNDFSEIGEVDEDRAELHQKALKIAKDEGISYSEAVDKANEL